MEKDIFIYEQSLIAHYFAIPETFNLNTSCYWRPETIDKQIL